MASRNWPSNKIYNQHIMPVMLDMQVAIGASGAPTIVTGSGKGIASITRLTTGIYRIQLQDNYNGLLDFKAMFQAPVTGGAVNMGSLSTASIYQIVTLGTSTQAQWVTAGVPAGITAAPGVVFKAAGAGAGNGTVKAIGTATTMKAELIGNAQLMLNNQPFTGAGVSNGGYITFQTLGPTVTMNSYTPAGTNSAPALTMNSYTPAGTNANDGPPETFTGTPATLTGTVAAPTFTGAAATLTGTVTTAATDPANGATMFIKILLSNSSVQ